MKLDKLKRKIHLLAFDQLPFVMKVLRIPPPAENMEGIDPEVEVEFEADAVNSENEEFKPDGFHDLEDGDALAHEKEIEIDESEADPVLEGAQSNEGAKLAFKEQLKLKAQKIKEQVNIDRIKNYKHEWASYSEEEKKEKKKKFFSIGVRALAVIVVLWVLLDDVIFSDEKNQNPQVAQTTEVSQNEEEVTGLDSELGEMDEQNVDSENTDIVDNEVVDSEAMDNEMDIDSEMNIEPEEDMAADNDQEAEIGMDFEEEITMNDSSDEMDTVDTNETTKTAESDDIADMASDESGDSEEASELEMTDFDKKGYEEVPEENKVNEVVFDEAGYKDITSEELETEVENSMTEEEKDQSPQDREIEGVSINVLRELEEKLKQKELERDQELLGKKEDLSLRGRKAPAVDYYRAGRSLVYNCQASHWACVDELSYLKCREADTVNNQKKANSTCQPYDIYVSAKDCQRAQYEYMDQEKGEASCLK